VLFRSKREGRPQDEEILSARVTDRSIRPLFPEGFKNEVQVFIYVLSADQENDADVLGVTAVSTALSLSKIPWNGPIAAVRVGRVEGAWILNPTFQQLEFSDVDMIVSGSQDSIVMVEGGALELSEGDIVKGLEVAHKGIRELIAMEKEIIADQQQPKMKWTKAEPPAELVARVTALAEPRITKALNGPEKAERAQALTALKAEIQEQLAAEFPENVKDVAHVIEDIEYHTMREQVLTSGERVDGRVHGGVHVVLVVQEDRELLDRLGRDRGQLVLGPAQFPDGGLGRLQTAGHHLRAGRSSAWKRGLVSACTVCKRAE